MQGWRKHLAGGGAHGTIPIVPGHEINARSVCEKIAEFDALSMPRILSIVEDVQVEIQKYKDSIDDAYFGSDRIFNAYRDAQARKNWRSADKLFLDTLLRDREMYNGFMDAEETARAFSAWLCGAALTSDHVYRWIDPPEVGSCTGGTFESRIDADGTRRGFKALTVNPGLLFGERKIRMRVPMSNAMYRHIRCVQYTALPRDLEEKDERVYDPKEAKHAVESEVRVLDGTPIPSGTDFVVMPGGRIDRETAKTLGARYKIAWVGE